MRALFRRDNREKEPPPGSLLLYGLGGVSPDMRRGRLCQCPAQSAIGRPSGNKDPGQCLLLSAAHTLPYLSLKPSRQCMAATTGARHSLVMSRIRSALTTLCRLASTGKTAARGDPRRATREIRLKIVRQSRCPPAPCISRRQVIIGASRTNLVHGRHPGVCLRRQPLTQRELGSARALVRYCNSFQPSWIADPGPPVGRSSAAAASLFSKPNDVDQRIQCRRSMTGTTWQGLR
jgi:hypothetical protein